MTGISHSMKDRDALFNCVAIFHLMRNPWPSHGSAWNICLLYNTQKACCVRAYMGAQRAESRYCCTVVVQFRTILCSAYDVTITLRCEVWICAILSRTEIVLWMIYALVARWLYLATRKKKDEIWLIPGTRFLSIVFKLVNIRGVVQHKWLMVWCMQWYDILHSVKNRHSIQLGFASLNRTSIFHLMRNLVPLHDQPLAICIPFHDHEIVPPTLFHGPCVTRPFWVIIHMNHMCVAQSAACAVQ